MRDPELFLCGGFLVPLRCLPIPIAGSLRGLRTRRARAAWPSYPGAVTCCWKIAKIYLI
ncbi:hypothetical protein PR003_g12994 [Phytophthora rubi]|uniref:Uncharacterized protein n=1 Tax=Phytophthora rubi TaxID=129364 RepID=A0A6A3M981_9STRA|nr:hypothetical protein PR002_g12550 [Phytophthora rubi]KAE9026500.1 hypothetical protein PR001_g12188 [Phytophthora rubi]KAE9335493.1 hypothetical protein PR003_g12994 [Phytophthora rubi]